MAGHHRRGNRETAGIGAWSGHSAAGVDPVDELWAPTERGPAG